MYIYIYVCVCVRVCVWRKTEKQNNPKWWIYCERKSTLLRFGINKHYQDFRNDDTECC